MNVIAGQKGFVARPALERFCEKVNKNGPLKPPGTAKQNSLEALERQRLGYALISHCKRGHPFDAENTRIHQEKGRPGGWRICRACARIRIQEFLARRAALSGVKSEDSNG